MARVWRYGFLGSMVVLVGSCSPGSGDGGSGGAVASGGAGTSGTAAVGGSKIGAGGAATGGLGVVSGGSGGGTGECAMLAKCCPLLAGSERTACDLAVQQSDTVTCGLALFTFAERCPSGEGGTSGAGAHGGSAGSARGGAASGGRSTTSGGRTSATGGSTPTSGGTTSTSGGSTGSAGRPAHCSDLQLNGGERFTDCGGPCGLCDEEMCSDHAQCASFVCRESHCFTGTCDDAILNHFESDVDCGGPYCAPCSEGRRCRELNQERDCASHLCANGTCVADSCTDGLKNGSETDVDCGRVCPTLCAIGKGCTAGADCANGSCFAGVAGYRCQFEHCTNRQQDGGEMGVDCGGPECTRCPGT